MQTIDIFVILFLLLPALFGYLYGLLHILMLLFVWGSSIVIAAFFYPELAPTLEAYIATPALRSALAFFGLLLVSVILLTLLGFCISRMVGGRGLTSVNRVFGFLSGFCLGVLIVQCVVILAGFTALPDETWWAESKTIKPFEWSALRLVKHLPERLERYYNYPVIKKEHSAEFGGPD